MLTHAQLPADHIVPVRDGGGECTVANAQVLCVACHKEKSAREQTQAAELRAAGHGGGARPVVC